MTIKLFVLAMLFGSALPAQISIGGGATGVGATVYNITIQGNGSTDNTTALNTALATCKDVLLDNGMIAGNIVWASNCHQTLYLTTALHYSVPMMWNNSVVGLQGGSALALYGPAVPITATGTIPTCSNSPVITATGTMGATSFTASSNTPLAIGSYVGFSSITGGPYKITGITGTTISIAPATLAAAVPGGTNVVCETPGPISINLGNDRFAGLNFFGFQVRVNGSNQPVAQIEFYNDSFYDGSAVPFVIDGALELSIEKSVFTSAGTHAVQITNDNATFIGEYIKFDTCLFNTGGLYINSNNFTYLPETITMTDTHYESLTADLVDVDTTDNNLFGLALIRVSSDDSSSMGYAIKDLSMSPTGIRYATIQDSSRWGALTLSNVTVYGLNGSAISLPQ